MYLFYDGCHFFYDDWMYHVLWMDLFTLLHLYHGLEEDDLCHIYVCNYSFELFIPCDLYSG